jgi:transcriptional regulator with XRE-family HTH domain
MARTTDFMTKVDIFIGGKIMEGRLALGLSRQTLASKIEITHQQLAKYENGDNRVAPGRLLKIAKELNKPITYFFVGADSEDAQGCLVVSEDQDMRVRIEIAKNLQKLRKETKMAINHFIKDLADIEAA